MPKLTISDLEKIRKRVKAYNRFEDCKSKVKITVHMGTCGIAAGAQKILDSITELLANSGQDDVILTTSGCAGFCSREPMATVELKGEKPVKYEELTKAKVEKIFSEHVLEGNIVEEYALAVGNEREA